MVWQVFPGEWRATWSTTGRLVDRRPKLEIESRLYPGWLTGLRGWLNGYWKGKHVLCARRPFPSKCVGTVTGSDINKQD